MYEDLIKDLRNCFGTDSMFCDCDSCHYKGLVDDHDYSKCVETLGVEAADAIERLQKPQWIPVTERLPEEYKDVLCYYEYFRYGDFNCMFRTIDRGYYGDGIWGGEAGQGHKNKVLAWMPLPEPPKGAGNG